MFEPELDNKKQEAKRKHYARVVAKQLEYMAKGLCRTHGTPVADRSRWACQVCLDSGATRARKYRQNKKGVKHG